MTYTDQQLRALVQPGRVHRTLFTDPEIFDLEMDRVFGQAWIYVAHESQLKKPGDFVTTRIGGKPVVVTRSEDGGIHVLRNQCAHRGVMVECLEKGNKKEFVCPYHGWVYNTDGSIKGVPLMNGYPGHFSPKDPSISMVPIARVSSYRGFVFANMSPAGPDLVEFLGHMTTSFDDMVDRAPDGEIELAGGVFKHAFDANWKVYLENLCDAAHPIFVHESSTEAAKVQSDETPTNGAGEIAIRQMRQNGAPYSFWESQVGIWTFPNGHCYLGDYHDDEKLIATMKDPVFREYILTLEAKKGKARAKEILEVRRWNSNVYPNLSFMSSFQQIRVVQPVSPNRTEVFTYCFRLKGAPDEMFKNTVRFANVVNGTGSLVLTDDLEIYGRIATGLAAEGAEWLEIGRGFQTDQPYEFGGRKGINSTSEVYLRNMYDAWVGLMTGGPQSISQAAE
jgi:phenylpropionate dioxygenase-like ring-hydroxylating dioxygenase large terminal subunit